MTKKKKKQTKKTKDYYNISIIIIACLLLLILIFIKLNPTTDFKIESKLDNIKQEQKKDKGNYKTIAWIKVQGTNIDYPVVIDKTKKYDKDVEKGSYGFSLSEEEKFLNNMTVIGHNVYNLGKSPKKESDKFERFESLMSFIYYDFAQENQYIQYTIDGKDYKYQIFAVSFLDNLEYKTELHDSSVSEKDNQYSIDIIKEESIYDYKIDVTGKDKILNVTTCTKLLGKNGKSTKFVISAKLVDNNRNRLVKVTKKDRYKTLEKEIAGGESNEETS